jgi:uncharacterized protein (DUF2249 family)
MKISLHTKISDIIRHDIRAIEAIASITPHFNKLRNPILRRVLAPRVTVQDAARIGKCRPEDILEKLRQIGFELNGAESPTPEPDSGSGSGSDLILPAIQTGKVQTLDVRPILEAGTDPFQAIMQKLKTVPDGYALEVVNSFEPTPLIKILGRQGYASWVKTEGEAVHTFFLKTGEAAPESQRKNWLFKVSPDALEAQRASFQGRVRETDVRDLEMPLPMVTILNEMEDLPEGHALFVHHKKTPQYLLPELEERGYQVWIADLGEGDVKLLIHR